MDALALVPILDETNYREWSAQMQAFLQANGLWRIVNGMATRPADPREAVKWDMSDDMAQGSISLRLSHNIRSEVGQTSAKTWTNLANAFKMSCICGDFRALVNFKISGRQHPAAEISHFFIYVERLKANGLTLQDDILGMMLLSSLPARWDHILAFYLQDKTAVNQIKFTDVHQAIIAYFDWNGGGSEQHTHHNHISTIKRKAQGKGHSKNEKKRFKHSKAKAPTGQPNPN